MMRRAVFRVRVVVRCHVSRLDQVRRMACRALSPYLSTAALLYHFEFSRAEIAARGE